MPVRRERVDTVRTPDSSELVHRRWIFPDDVRRPVTLSALSRLWRGLLDLNVTDLGAEARLERLALSPPQDKLPARTEMPASASAGALLAGAGSASLVTQLVWLEDAPRRDPYHEPPYADDYRDYTVYAVTDGAHVLLAARPRALWCGGCGQTGEPGLRSFGEGLLLPLSRRCPQCGVPADLGRDKAELRLGATLLLEEIACTAALSIELPQEPAAEELPDAEVAGLLRETLGGTDELAEDGVEMGG